MVCCESEQEMGGRVFHALHSFLAHSLPRHCRPFQTLRGEISEQYRKLTVYLFVYDFWLIFLALKLCFI